MPDDDDKTPADHLLDLFVFAPLGFVLEAEDLVPRLVEKGRTTLGAQVGMARMLGQMVVAQGRRELDPRVEHLRDSAPCGRRGSAPTPEGPFQGGAATPVVVLTPEADDAVLEEQELVVDAAGVDAPRHDADEAAELAVPGYDSLAASQVVPRLAGLTPAELEAVRLYEAAHRGRRTILNRIGQLQAGR